MSTGERAVSTDDLVVGSGPAGASAAERLMREATPWPLMSNTTLCTGLAGDELGRVPSWGTDTRRHADYELQSPCTMLDAPQTITEPVIMQAAQARGAKVRFDTEYLSHTQDDSAVTTTVRDRLTGSEYAIGSKYLVGADGARSKVAADLDLPFEGPGAVGGGHGAFSLWTGIGGEAWIAAAESLTAESGLPITPVKIGPKQVHEDPYGTWAELREIEDGGVVLVRPAVAAVLGVAG